MHLSLEFQQRYCSMSCRLVCKYLPNTHGALFHAPSQQTHLPVVVQVVWRDGCENCGPEFEDIVQAYGRDGEEPDGGDRSKEVAAGWVRRAA